MLFWEGVGLSGDKNGEGETDRERERELERKGERGRERETDRRTDRLTETERERENARQTKTYEQKSIATSQARSRYKMKIIGNFCAVREIILRGEKLRLAVIQFPFLGYLKLFPLQKLFFSVV